MPRSLILLSLLLTGCVDYQNQYAPARARRPDFGPDPKSLKQSIEMKDPASLEHFAWGIDPAAFDGEKRKAEPKAALRFLVTQTSGQKVVVDFVSPQAQVVRFKVNGRLLSEISATGAAHFEAPVEQKDFVADTATLVEIESEAGISLLRAGIVRR